MAKLDNNREDQWVGLESKYVNGVKEDQQVDPVRCPFEFVKKGMQTYQFLINFLLKVSGLQLRTFITQKCRHRIAFTEKNIAYVPVCDDTN